MTSPGRETVLDRPGQSRLVRLRKPIAEWLVWVSLGIIVYFLTGEFDQKIAEYAYGPTGWPRALCIAVVVGATGQLAYQALTFSGSYEKPVGDEGEGKASTAGPKVGLRGWRLVQRLGIFALPLIYLFFVPAFGFYVVTPFFIAGLLLLLEVRTPSTLLSVTAVIYLLLLLIFTRLFYVALPVGRIPFFYDLNNAVIVLARTGL